MADIIDSPAPPTKADEGTALAREVRDEAARAYPDARTLSLAVLAILAVFYTLYFAADFVLPCVFAMVLNLLLGPLMRLLRDRMRVPAILAAMLLIALLFAIIGALAFAISLPASTWVAKAPDSIDQLRRRLSFIGPAVDAIQHGMQGVQHALQGQPAAGPTAQNPVMVQQQQNPLGRIGLTILLGTRAAVGELFILIAVLFFLLIDGDSLLRRTVEILPTFGEKRRAVEIANEIQSNIAGYLITITAMNALVGIANGVSMWLLGMPNPLLWGTLAFMLNYIPILGPFTGIVIFCGVGLFSAPTLLGAALPALTYFGVHLIEGQTVTPMLLARRFTLNPVLVIVSLFFWDWLWGVPGAFLAVPLLAIAKTVCDHIEPLAPLGHLIGGAPRSGSRPA
jgi:predicted PurR-regulated permease PerM